MSTHASLIYGSATKKQAGKGRYKTDLVAEHAVAELNYRHFVDLIGREPERESYPLSLLISGLELAVEIDITERCPYTTMLEFKIAQARPDEQAAYFMMGLPDFSVRLYHDVKLAEIVRCQYLRRPKARYDYPNKSMLLPDEKRQSNILLAEWLAEIRRSAYSCEEEYPLNLTKNKN